MKLLISKCDYLSHKVSLTLNEKGDVGYKTFIGGLISIISIIISIICILFFIIKMFKRDDIYINHSTYINPYINLTYSHKLPFLIRLTNTNSEPYDDMMKMKNYIILQQVFGMEEQMIQIYLILQNNIQFL